jgi:PAS domain S-box-containing protein
MNQNDIADAISSLSSLFLLADALPQLVWSAGPDGQTDYFNQRWYDYTGTIVGQTQRLDWSDVIYPEDVPQAQSGWEQAVAGSVPYEVEYRLRSVHGTYRWFLVRGVPLKEESGHVVRWFGTCTDIDDQKRAQLELARLSARERHIAEALQGAVQPVLRSGIPGLDMASYYKAALSEANVGGDFSDAFPLEKGCHALVVGDLSGKGLAAASQVAAVRNMLRYALYTGRTIAEAITRLNNILIANELLDGFATLVVAAFDLPQKTLTYVSCGQEPALLRRSAGGNVDELPPTGAVLGMSESSVYQENVIPLAAGDAFALYTDGLTEAGPDRRHLLGVSGLASIFQQSQGTAQEMVDQVIGGVEAYSNGVFRDDVCLLVGIMKRAHDDGGGN